MNNGVNKENDTTNPVIVNNITDDVKTKASAAPKVPTEIDPMTGRPKEVYPTYTMPGLSTPKVEEEKKVDEPVVDNVIEETKPEEIKPVETVVVKKSKLPKILLLIIILLIVAIVFLYYTNNLKINNLVNSCTPVSTTGDNKELDVNSTIVQDLYSKYSTTIREDIANPNFDDKLKIYLAYRNIPTRKIYESNCNLFNGTSMEPYKCEVSETFVPTAIKEEDIQLEIKTLFGEFTNIQNQNIQLYRSCLGGYQYIADRGEYVQGYCGEVAATQFRKDASIEKAISQNSTIKIYEKVKYVGNEGINPPEYLRSGVYVYTFKLDPNYNYVLLSRELEG